MDATSSTIQAKQNAHLSLSPPQEERPFIPVPFAACDKASLECRLTGEAH